MVGRAPSVDTAFLALPFATIMFVAHLVHFGVYT